MKDDDERNNDEMLGFLVMFAGEETTGEEKDDFDKIRSLVKSRREQTNIKQWFGVWGEWGTLATLTKLN